MRSTEITKQVEEQRDGASLACVLAVVICLFWVTASSFLYAAHVKSGATAGNRPAGMEKPGSLSEVDRGPRGKNEIALTFDAGAEAECFDDPAVTMANARRGRSFLRDIARRIALEPH